MMDLDELTVDMIDSLRRRIDSWKLNSGNARVSVPLDELRAIVKAYDDLVEHNEDMALDAKVEDRW